MNQWLKMEPVYIIIFTFYHSIQLHVKLYLLTYSLEIVVTVETLVLVVTCCLQFVHNRIINYCSC